MMVIKVLLYWIQTVIYLDNPVACVDYASVYPSSMISENLSNSSKVWTREFIQNSELLCEEGEKNGDNFIYDNLPGYQYFDITCDVYIVINDQHPIKQRFFSEFLKQNNIKQKFRQSYSPQPQEATNRVLRNTMRAKFIQPGKLIRKPCINDL